MAAWARSETITTKLRRRDDGTIRSGGKPFSRGNLHALLNYRTYIGEVTHKGNAYPGEQAGHRATRVMGFRSGQAKRRQVSRQIQHRLQEIAPS